MSLQFWRTKDFSDESLLDLVSRTFGVTFTNVTDARTWLNANGYFTSYPDDIDNGLVLNLDAQNLTSFAGEATINLVSTLIGIGNHTYSYPGAIYQCTVLESNISSNSAPNGTYSRFTGNGDSTNQQIWWYLTQGGLNEKNTEITISCWLSGSGTCWLNNYDDALSYGSSSIITLSNEWVRYSYTRTVGDYTSSNWAGVRGILDTTDLYISGFQIERKSHSTNYVEGTRGSNCGTGGGWCDLKNSYNVSFINTPIQGSNYYISFDGSSNYGIFDTAYTFNTGNGTNYTFEVWFKMRTLPTEQYGSNGHIWGGQNGNNVVLYLNPVSNGVSKGIMVYDDTRYLSTMMTTGGFIADTWAQWVIVGDGSGNTVTHYINGKLDTEDGVVSPETQYVKGWTGTHIAYDTRWGTYSELDISIMKQYNRKLTGAEVLKNFNTYKTRFGL